MNAQTQPLAWFDIPFRRISRSETIGSSSMTDNHTGHSAEVKMHVVRDGSKLQVSQLGPDFLLLDEADDFEGPAQVVLSVDGVTHSCDVQLQRGSTSIEKTISFL